MDARTNDSGLRFRLVCATNLSSANPRWEMFETQTKAKPEAKPEDAPHLDRFQKAVKFTENTIALSYILRKVLHHEYANCLFRFRRCLDS